MTLKIINLIIIKCFQFRKDILILLKKMKKMNKVIKIFLLLNDIIVSHQILFLQNKLFILVLF